ACARPGRPGDPDGPPAQRLAPADRRQHHQGQEAAGEAARFADRPRAVESADHADRDPGPQRPAHRRPPTADPAGGPRPPAAWPQLRHLLPAPVRTAVLRDRVPASVGTTKNTASAPLPVGRAPSAGPPRRYDTTVRYRRRSPNRAS